MRRLKAILIEEGLLGRGPGSRKANSNIDQTKVRELVDRVLRNPQEHFDGDFDALEFEWEELDSEDANADDNEPDPGEWYLPIGGEFESYLAFSSKTLGDYPELLDREFMFEVLEAIYKKMGPLDFIFNVIHPEQVTDAFEDHKDDPNPPYYKVKIKGYKNGKVTPLRSVGEPKDNGRFVTLSFRFKASFEPEYRVEFNSDKFYSDLPPSWRYQQRGQRGGEPI